MAKTTLGEYIRSLRTKRDIGVRELGRAVDVSGVHISSIEKGKNAPSLNTLMKSKGIHPIGEVFLIMNWIETSPVKIMVSFESLLVTFR